MRNHKYRAWHSREQCWHYFTLTDLVTGRPASDSLRYQNWCEWTGLLDSRGVEIYEGDWLDFTTFDYNGADTQWRGVVVWEGTRFMLWKSPTDELYGQDGGFDLDISHFNDDEIEVIGNIHENPELLDD